MLDNQNTVQQLINEVNLLRTQLDAIANSVVAIEGSNALATEIIDRTNADNALDDRIDQEITDRITAISDAYDSINQEIIDRTNADNSKANLNGNPLQKFKAANGIDNDDVVNVGQLNQVASIIGGTTHSILYGLNNNFTINPYEIIRVLLIGGGGGSGGSGGGGSGFANNGTAGGNSQIYLTSNPSSFIVKSLGGLGGGGAYGGNGSSFAQGSNAVGREVEIDDTYSVLILSYQDGLTGNLNSDTPIIKHPTIKKLGLTLSGRGAKGTYGGGTAISGAASGGAFVEALIVNTTNSELQLTIDCGAGGLAGTGNESNGINGNDGVCVIIRN